MKLLFALFCFNALTLSAVERAAQPRNPDSSGQDLRELSGSVAEPNGSAHLRSGESPAFEAGVLQIRAIVVTEESPEDQDFSDANGIVSDLPLPEFLAAFLGKQILPETLQALKKAVLLSLEEVGKFAPIVSFPDQDVSSGVVVLQVSPALVESVKVTGNQWKSDSYYEKQLSLSTGNRLETPQLLDQVAWFNRNPFQYAEVVLAPASTNDGVNIEVLVKDRFALRPFVGADNTGTNLTNQVRLFAGISCGRPFGRPDLFTYQYMTAPNPHEFYSHTGSYLLFLPWKHELTVYGGFSSIHPDIPHFSHEGISVQASLRYAIPLGKLSKATKQTFSFGADYKNINSNVFFIEVSPAIPVIAHQANIFQLYLNYAWQDNFLFKAEAYGSPAQWLPNQTDARYEMLRPHAIPQYFYARLALGHSYEVFKKASLFWLFRAQGASGPLLPSEQFCLGGYDTVRGYKERDFLADNALLANIEIRLPKCSPFRKGELVFLGFCDIGGGYNFQSEQSNQQSQFLWSAGLGARYRISPHVDFRADYGVQLHNIFGQNAFGRFHLGGSLSY